MTTRLLRFPLEAGEDHVLVEVAAVGGGPQPAAGGIGDAEEQFEAVMDRVRVGMNTIMAKLNELETRPAEIEVEFGVKVATGARVIFTSADVKANFKVKLKWTRPEE